MKTPTGFIPTQDKGYLLVNVQLPDSSSVVANAAGDERRREMALKQPGVAHTVGISGQSILLNANAPNFGAMYLMLDEFGKRNGPGLSADEIAASLQAKLEDAVPAAVVNIFQAPPIEGLGTAGGFKIIIEDRGNEGLVPLEQATDEAIDRGEAVLRGDKRPALEGLFTSFRAQTPWLRAGHRPRPGQAARPVHQRHFRHACRTKIGSYYVNDFNKFGRTWQVNVQAQDDFRQQVDGPVPAEGAQQPERRWCRWAA